MALQIQHKRGSVGSLPSLAYGELALVTNTNPTTGKDRYQLYAGTNGDGNKLIGGTLVDTSLPTFNASEHPAGTIFLVVGAATGEDSDIYISTGAEWELIGVNNLSSLSGTLDDIADGSTYGKVLLTYLNDSGAVTQLLDESTGGVVITGTDIQTHFDATSGVHGVTGNVVGTSDSQTLTNKTFGSGNSLSADLDANSNKITNLATPTADGDAVNKSYADSLSAGLDPKQSVVAATTTNITLSTDVENGDTLDGVVLSTGDRILIKDQSTASENGIYVVNASGAPTRATDFDGTPTNEVDGGEYVFVADGTVNEGNGFVVIDEGLFTGTGNYCVVGTDPITFSQFSGAGNITAGDGLTKTGDTIDFVAADNSLTVNADSVAVNVDDITLEVDGTTGGALQVKDLGISTAKLADNSVTEAKLNTSVAGVGLTGGGGSALALDLNELTTDTAIVSGDFIPFVDVDGPNTSEKITIDNFVTSITGTGLTQSGITLGVAYGGTGTGELQTVDSNSDGTPSAGVLDLAARIDHKHILEDIDCGTF